MIALTPEAETQVDRLILHFESRDRLEAAINLLKALDRARRRIATHPEVELEALRPYPDLESSGRRWITEGRYWISYSLTTPPIISGVFYAIADIPGRI